MNKNNLFINIMTSNIDIRDININYDQFQDLMNILKSDKYLFVNENLKILIERTIKSMFPNLNSQDTIILNIFTIALIEKISRYFNITDIEQWNQNNQRDIKGIVLIILPFIDDRDNGRLLFEMTDLNQFIFNKSVSYINNDILNEDKADILKSQFKFSNMGIGLLKNSSPDNRLLELYENDNKMKIIYKIIHHNFLGILKTLQIISGKLYVNWINTVPLLLETYKESRLYINTKNGLIEFINIILRDIQKQDEDLLNTNITKFMYDYYGLWLGDIYNTIKIKLYDEIKSIKWLIFNTNTLKQKYIIKYLDEIFNMELFFTVNDYDDVAYNEQNNFENQIIKEIIKVKTDNSYFEIWKQIFLFMCNNYSRKFIIQQEHPEFFEKLYLNMEDFNDDSQTDDFKDKVKDKIINITQKDIIDFMEVINEKHIWNYIYESIKKLEITYLKDYLIENNKIKDNYFYKNTNLSFKNIYNIAKSLTHTEIFNDEKIWKSLPNHFTSCNITIIIHFYYLLINASPSSWLNLQTNIKREYGNVDYNTKLNEIYKSWKDNYLDLIFEILIKNGLLTEFQTDLYLSNKKMFISSNPYPVELRKRFGEKMRKNPQWKEAYYYLTNDKYKNLEKITVENKKTKKIETIDYFTLIEQDQNWLSFYALDWLSQINFFHHYIHHRIIYVTGATGQGKSTQVPKLLMYALKAYEYKFNGKVVCTQPRIPPTKNTVDRVSAELGLPVFSLDNKNEKIKTNNFYLQMKYSEDSHVKNNCPHLTLKIMTDGTLIEELQNNLFMKEQIFKPGKEDYVLGLNNFYDIIVLDESHEHNPNMDMILTLARQSCYYNNSLKLVIMSATMDDDEPTYRTYFKYINDMLRYPIKAPEYTHPYLDLPEIKNKFIADTIYMDRRFHISPPGETTQYVVQEVYTTLSIDNLTDLEASKKVQEESYKKILEICSSNPTGEVLFFANGKREIINAVKRLNEILPDGNIALPYYSDMNDKYKDIIEKINVKISTIKNKRNKIHDEWTEVFIEDLTVPNNIYKRAVIVATNVAEASITIETLKFVVDNGYAKVNTFNPDLKITVLEVEKISEASRIQRKGRVGRTGDGTVYFMYPKGSREKIMPKYKITQEDSTPRMLKLLSPLIIDDNTKINIVKSIFDPNYYFIDNNAIYKNITITKKEKLDSFYKMKIDNVFKYQYRLNPYLNQLLDINLYWNKKYYDSFIDKSDPNYHKLIIFEGLIRNEQGFNMNSLLDVNGVFYIVHPLEHLIKRNVNNEIIKFKDVKTNQIPNYIYSDTMEFLLHNLVLINPSPTGLNESLLDSNYSMFYKSELYKRVLYLKSKILDNTLSFEDCLIIFVSKIYNVFDQVLLMISFIKQFGNGIDSICNSTKINEFYNNFMTDGELSMIYNIVSKLVDELSNNLLIFKIITNKNIKYVEQKSKILDLINKFSEEYNKNKNVIPKDYNKEIWDELVKLYNKGELSTNGLQTISYVFYKNELLDDLKKNKIKVESWADSNYCDKNKIYYFIESFIKLYIDIITYRRNLDIKLKEPDPFTWFINVASNFTNSLRTNSNFEKIIKCFIMGKPRNYGIKINNSNIHFNLYKSSIFGIVLESKTRKNIISNNVVFYYNYLPIKNSDNDFNDIDNDKTPINIINLNFVEPVPVEYFIDCVPQIFNKHYFRRNRLIIKHNIKKIGNTLVIQDQKDYMIIDGDNYNSILHKINNRTLLKSFWESPYLPDIKNIFNNLRKLL